MRATSLIVLYIAIYTAAMVTEGKRVVILPMPFTSHTKYQTNVARALTKLGHQVWVTIPDHLVAKQVLDTSNMTVVEYLTQVGDLEQVMMRGFRDAYFRGESEDWALYLNLLKDHCHALLSNQTFFSQIRSLQPDFIIVDNIPNLKMMSVLAYRLGVPFAFVGSAYDGTGQRTPFSPAFTPVPLFPFTDRMTFSQRLQNSLINVLSALHDFSSYADAVGRYAPEMPYVPLDLLVAGAELWLVEMDHVLDYPRSTLPNVKLIGGTATGPAKPLKPPFKQFMDGASEGVVIVSFGSYVLNVPKDISDKVFAVLMQIPMKSIFRSNLTSPDPSKIMTSTWIPQNDLLGHKNTKAFVSHCGKNGQYEALFHAVPIVATPIFADQPYNAERMRVKGFGETVDIRTISADDLKATILKVATEKSYKQAIGKASEIFRIEFGVPMERAAFWLDHVMKYGGAYMRSAGQEMPFYQFICLDLILCYIAVLVVFFSLLGACVYKSLKLIFPSRKRKVE